MKSGQGEIVFFKNYAENEAGNQFQIVFEKALYEVKASGLQPRFNIF